MAHPPLPHARKSSLQWLELRSIFYLAVGVRVQQVILIIEPDQLLQCGQSMAGTEVGICNDLHLQAVSIGCSRIGKI